MKRRSFLTMAPAAGLAAWLPQRAFPAVSPPTEAPGIFPRETPAVGPKNVEAPRIRIMGARSFGHSVIQQLPAFGVARAECLYGATVKPDSELGSRRLVVFSDSGVLNWDERAREIQEADILVGVGRLGDTEHSAVPALEELAHLSNQAGGRSPIAVVCLPPDGKRSMHRQPSLERLCALEQLRDIQKAYSKVITVDANRFVQDWFGSAELELTHLLAVQEAAACVTAVLSMVRASDRGMSQVGYVPLRSGSYASARVPAPSALQAATDAFDVCLGQLSEPSEAEIRVIHAYVQFNYGYDISSIFDVIADLRASVSANVSLTVDAHYRLPAFGPSVDVRLIAGA